MILLFVKYWLQEWPDKEELIRNMMGLMASINNNNNNT